MYNSAGMANWLTHIFLCPKWSFQQLVFFQSICNSFSLFFSQTELILIPFTCWCLQGMYSLYIQSIHVCFLTASKGECVRGVDRTFMVCVMYANTFCIQVNLKRLSPDISFVMPEVFLNIRTSEHHVLLTKTNMFCEKNVWTVERVNCTYFGHLGYNTDNLRAYSEDSNLEMLH